MESDRRRDSPATTTPSSFYKIILPSVLHSHRLRVPEDFSKKYGNELSTSVKLTVRSGQVSCVGVEKADKMLWFTHGWKEFSKNHSIGFGFFVVFNYEGDSKFKVLIFDLTATEIYNPQKTLGISKEPNKGKPESHKGDRGSNGIVQKLKLRPSRPALISLEDGILDGCRDQRRTVNRCCHSLIQNMYEFAPEFALRISKRGRCISSLESLRFNFHYFTRNKRCKMEDQGKIVKVDNVTASWVGKKKASEMPNSLRPLVHKAEKEKLKVTKNVDNLPAAVPFGQHCCLSNGVRVKSLFSREAKECQHKQLDSVIVREGTRKRKGIGYQLNETKHTKNADEFNPSNAANHEITDSNGRHEVEEQLLGVKDSRNDSMMRPVTTQDREKAVNASRMFKPNNPFFTKIMQPYNVHKSYILNVPCVFAKKYLHGVSHNFIQLEVSGGKQWTVRCTKVKGVVQVLSSGWSQFAKGNNLVEGDVCVFELIQVEDLVLKVSIFRASEDTRQTNLPNHERTDSNGQLLEVKHEEEEELLGVKDSRNDSMMGPVATRGREKAVNASMMFKANNPFFTKTLQRYNVHRGFIVNVPAGFAKKYLHGVSDSIQLEVSGGEQWTISCTRVNGVVKVLSGGWSQFAKDNKLAEGDVCVFELIQVEDLVLKVSISRACEDTRQTNLPN